MCFLKSSFQICTPGILNHMGDYVVHIIKMFTDKLKKWLKIIKLSWIVVQVSVLWLCQVLWDTALVRSPLVENFYFSYEGKVKVLGFAYKRGDTRDKRLYGRDPNRSW